MDINYESICSRDEKRTLAVCPDISGMIFEAGIIQNN